MVPDLQRRCVMRCLAIALLLMACVDDPNVDDPDNEICDNEIDDDGDSAADCDDVDCAADPACQATGEPVDIQLTTYHTFRRVSYEENAPLVAFADGLGAPFVPLTGAGGVYDFTVTSADGRYSVLVACEGRGGVRLHHALASEGTDLHMVGCLSVTEPFPQGTFAGTVVNHTCLNAAVGFSSVLSGCGLGNWIADAPLGPNDIIAQDRAPTQADPPVRIYVEHGINLAANNQAHQIDFQSALSAPAVTNSVTGMPNQLGRAVEFFTRYTGSNMSPSATAYVGVPAALRQPEDIHRWCLGVLNGERFCTYFKEPVDLVAAEPPVPEVTGTAAVVATSPYPLHQVDWDLAGGDPITGYRFELLGDPNRVWTVHASAGFMGGETVYQIPDLSAVAGFTEPLHPAPDAGWRLNALGDGALIDVANAFYIPTTAADGLSYWSGLAFF